MFVCLFSKKAIKWANRYRKRCSVSAITRKCKSNQWAIVSPLLEWLASRKQGMTSVGRVWREGTPRALWVGMQISAATTENRMKVFPKQLNMELPYDPASPLFGIYPGNETTILKRYLHPMFGAPLLSISKTWKQPKCLLIDEWTKKIRVCECVCRLWQHGWTVRALC